MLKNRTKNIYINISFERKNSCEFYSKMQFKKKERGRERGRKREKRNKYNFSIQGKFNEPTITRIRKVGRR